MGVKQGCPMLPTLFGLYMEHHLSSHAQDAPSIQGQLVPILLYADDIRLLSKSCFWFTASPTCPSPVLRCEVAYCQYVKNIGCHFQ